MLQVLLPDVSLNAVTERLLSGSGVVERFAVASSAQFETLAQAFSNLIASQKSDDLSFDLGVVGEPDIGKTFFTDTVLKQGGAFTTYARDSNNQLVGFSENLGCVVRSDIMVGGARDQSGRLFSRYTPANTHAALNLTITEHPLFGEKTNYHAIVTLANLPIAGLCSQINARAVSLCADETLANKPAYDAFLRHTESLRL